MKKTLLISLAVLIACFSLTLTVSAAAKNPYPESQDSNGDGLRCVPCTWYAWQQAYDHTGIALPNWGNAKNWYSRAESAGYAVGSEARPHSIAVWSSSTYGHVSYVVSVNGNKMTVNEGGQEWDNTVYNGNGIWNNHVVTSVVGELSPGGKPLIGFIYLDGSAVSSAPTIKHGYSGSADEITESNAVVYATVTKPASATTERFGIRIRRTSNTYENGWSYYHASSSSYSGKTSIKIWFDIQKEVGITLTHATSYTYQLYAKIDGKEYWSEEKTITTKGSHSYGKWTTAKEATCTATGSKQRKCACGAVETEAINALGHSYSASWTIDAEATCTTAGSKSHHCTACSAKKDVTSIAATGHSFSQWTTVKEATCTAAGNSQRKCSCGATEYKSVDALGHNWSAWGVAKEATVEEAGEERRNCTRCNAVDSKTIPQLATDGHKHNYEENEWIELTPATCTQDGTKIRYCGLCHAAEIQTIPALSHDLSDWQTVLEPTAEQEGMAVQNCVRCTYTEEMSLPKLNMPDTTLPAYDPSDDTPTSPTPTEVPSQPGTPSQDGTDTSKTLIVLTAVSLLFGAGSIGALIVIVVNKKKR